MTDYSKLKDLHPEAKVGNIKRLIAAIRRSESVPAIPPISDYADDFHYSNISDSPRMKHSRNLSGRGPDRVGFEMGSWIQKCGPEKGECGTWACIAGFAHIMGGGKRVPRSGGEWVNAFAEFTGLTGDNLKTAHAICAPAWMTEKNPSPWRMEYGRLRASHAVRLLERLLETGKVDWGAARGAIIGKGAERQPALAA